VPTATDPIELTSPPAARTAMSLAFLTVVGSFAAASLVGSRLAMVFALGVLGVVVLLLDVETIKRVLVAVLLLEMAVPIDRYYDHDEAVAALNSTSGYNVSLGTMALAVLSLLLLAERFAGIRKLPTPVALIPRSSTVYLLVVAGSVLWALAPSLALAELVLLAQAIVAYLCLVTMARTRADVTMLLTLLTAGLLVQSLLVLGAMALGGEFVMEPIAVRLVHGRAGGTFGSPNVLGSYITFMLAPTMALIAMRISRLHSALAWLALLLGGMALILSESRGAWIGSAIAFAVFVPVGLRRKWLSTRLVVGLMAAGVAAMAAFGPIILNRLAAFDNAAAQARFPLNRLAWGVIRENPVLGVGANNFATAMSNHLTVDFSTAWISTVHNKYLLVWSETGLIGLLAFGAFLAGVLWCGLRLGRMVEAPLSPFGIAVIGSFLGVMFHMLVELFHGRIQIQVLWVMAAVVQTALAVELAQESTDASTDALATVDA
jgi:putative inorganic carbon (hco3(-)) transporter